MAKNEFVQIFEVGPRDGLQNEKQTVSIETRVRFINRLCQSGLSKIEIGSFVSPKWVPQMQGSEQVIEAVVKKHGEDRTQFSALVPNLRGLEDALKTSIQEIAIFGAASEGFSKANINCTIEESLTRFSEITQVAKSKKLRMRGYLSTVFGCPFDGKVDEKVVLELIEKYLNLGIYEISLGDTIGVAHPGQVRSLLTQVLQLVPASKIAMHFHDTRGTGLANILASLDLGIRTFDSSLGGLGGCPYAPNSTGNVATEDVVYMLHGMGFETGINLESLIETNHWMGQQMSRTLPSRVGRAGVPKL